MANIAEGFARKSDKEFSQFLFVAKSSAAELQSHAYVALDQGYVTDAEFTRLYQAAEEESKRISSLIKYLASSASSAKTQRTQ